MTIVLDTTLLELYSNLFTSISDLARRKINEINRIVFEKDDFHSFVCSNQNISLYIKYYPACKNSMNDNLLNKQYWIIKSIVFKEKSIKEDKNQNK